MMYAKEGFEAVRNIRDEDFTNLEDGVYGLSLINGEWSLVLTEDLAGIFQRIVEIESVDQHKKEITVSVFWQQGPQKEVSISFTGYLTNWMREQDEMGDILGYWPLDEGVGCLTYDISGNHEGSLEPSCPTNSPLWVQGKVNTALLFDGGDDMVVVENSPALNPTNELTITAWVRWDSPPENGNEWATIINKNGDSQYRIQHNRINEYFEFAIRTSSGNRWIISTTSPQEDVWYHVAGTYDGEDLKIYVNGVMENSTNWSGSINTSNAPLVFGNRIWGDRGFDGIIDEIGLWGRALTDAEIEELYLEGVDDDVIESCSDYCKSISYTGGICRQNPRQCANNNENYESGGDVYCPGPPQRDCCCF